MEDLKPIPIPIEQRWQDFRVKYVPLLMFAVLVAAICWMWSRYVEPPAIVGEVESVHADIMSTTPGTIESVLVDRLQAVTNGQELATVSVLDSDQLKSELAAAETDLLLLKARMDIDKTRNMDSYAHMRSDLTQEELALEVAKIRLKQTDAEFDRAQKLLEGQLMAKGVSSAPFGNFGMRNDFGYDVVVRDRDALRAEVAAREKSVTELTDGVKKMEVAGLAKIEPMDAAVEQAIRAHRNRIELMQRPVVLRAPIDGFVSDLNHHTGERISAGVDIMVVSANGSDRILAWMRQPIGRAVKVGDKVEVRRISIGGTLFDAKVVQVGKQLEKINPALLLPNRNPERPEVGLPLLVQAKDVLQLVPGEAVQLRLLGRAENAAN